MGTNNRVCSSVEVSDSVEETEVDEEMVLSDQDSVSLLQDLPAFPSRAAAEVMAVTNSDSKAANIEIKNKLELNEQKRQKPKSCKGKKSAAGSAACPSRPAKVPNEKDLHKRNNMGETRLHKACQKGDLAQVRMLLQAGICVNVEDYAGWTALHEACAAGDESVVEELLRAGAHVNARSCDGVTPLHDAVYAGHRQVVKLLLKNGSNPTDPNVGGLSALAMAQDTSMRELLLTFQASSEEQRETRGGAAAPCGEPEGCEGGAVSAPASSTPHGRLQSFSHSFASTTDFNPRGSVGPGGEPVDAQLRRDGVTNDSLPAQSCSVAVSAVLEAVGRKQAEISTWTLTDLQDVGRYKAAVLQTQNLLTDALAKQRLETNRLTQKFSVVSDNLRQRVLKSQLLSLASSQRRLVKLLHSQTELEGVYVTAKANISSHRGSIAAPFNPKESPVTGRRSAQAQPAGTPGCHQDTVQGQRRRPAPQISRLQPKDKSAPAFPDSRAQKAPQPRAAFQLRSKMKGKNAVKQTGAKDGSPGLRQLVHRGVLPQGSALHLTLKGKHHEAHVRSDGFVISNGKSYRAPEGWLESIFGNNIPVSSTYALDKVTFRNKPLSYYFLNLEAKPNPSEIDLRDDVGQNKDGSTQREPSPEPQTPFQLLRKIQTIHLVNSEELLPNVVMDYYWDELLKQDRLDFDDWDREL